MQLGKHLSGAIYHVAAALFTMIVSSNFSNQCCLARSVQHKEVTSPHYKILPHSKIERVKPYDGIQGPHSCTMIKHVKHFS